MQGQRGCISITLICAIIAYFLGFSLTSALLGCSLHLVHAQDVTAMQLMLKQSVTRNAVAELRITLFL